MGFSFAKLWPRYRASCEATDRPPAALRSLRRRLLYTLVPQETRVGRRRPYRPEETVIRSNLSDRVQRDRRRKASVRSASRGCVGLAKKETRTHRRCREIFRLSLTRRRSSEHRKRLGNQHSYRFADFSVVVATRPGPPSRVDNVPPVPSSRRNFQSYLRRPIETGHLARVISRASNGRFHGEIGTAGRLISGDTFSRVSRRQRTLRDRDANAPNESGATSFSAGKLSMPPCPGRPLHRFWARG